MDSKTRSHAHFVLVVADYSDAREAYALMLRIEGVEVVMAWGVPDAAAALIAGARPCLVFVDLQTIDALGFARQIHADAPNVPLVFLRSGRGRSPASRFSGVLQQPVDTEILSAAVRKYCTN
jgi:CheY-like chemotaxis protein